MKKLLVVALASLALALNFGLASAHPFADPTPPPAVDNGAPAAPSATETDVEQEGDNHDGAMDEAQTGDQTESDTDMNEKQDRNTEQDGESEGDN